MELSSSVGYSSPCGEQRFPVGRHGTGNDRRQIPADCRSTSAEESTPTNVTSSPIGLDIGSLHSRKNLVTGGERILLEFARDKVYYYALFQDAFPSAPDLTSFIHTAWEDAERHYRTHMEASPESLAIVSVWED